MTEKKNNHTGLKVGLGLAAIAAAGGAYYLMGKDGKKRRAKAAAWVDEAKKELAKKVEAIKDMSQEIYSETVDKVLLKYKKFQKENPEEFAKLISELKGHWKYIQEHLADKKQIELKKQK